MSKGLECFAHRWPGAHGSWAESDTMTKLCEVIMSARASVWRTVWVSRVYPDPVHGPCSNDNRPTDATSKDWSTGLQETLHRSHHAPFDTRRTRRSAPTVTTDCMQHVRRLDSIRVHIRPALHTEDEARRTARNRGRGVAKGRRPPLMENVVEASRAGQCRSPEARQLKRGSAQLDGARGRRRTGRSLVAHTEGSGAAPRRQCFWCTLKLPAEWGGGTASL